MQNILIYSIRSVIVFATLNGHYHIYNNCFIIYCMNINSHLSLVYKGDQLMI